jgi:hypothetical protein
MLVGTWAWAYQPPAQRIALSLALTAAHEKTTSQYEAAIANRAEYETIKTDVLAELRRTNVEPTMARLEAAFVRQVDAIAKQNNVPWRVIQPTGSAQVTGPLTGPPPTPAPGIGALAEIVPAVKPADLKAIADAYQGVVEVKPLKVSFRGRNSGVLKALHALGNDPVLTSVTASGLEVQNTPDGPKVLVQANVLIYRLNVDEQRLFPPSATLKRSVGSRGEHAGA